MVLYFRRKNHIIFKSINNYASTFYVVYKKAFFQRHYMSTIKEYHDFSIAHAYGHRFTNFGSSSLREHIQ